MLPAAQTIITSSTIIATAEAITHTRCDDIRLQVVRAYPAIYVRAWDAIEAAGYTDAEEVEAAFALLPKAECRLLMLVHPSGEMTECESFITLDGCSMLALKRIDEVPSDQAAAGLLRWVEHYAERVERHRQIRARVIPIPSRAHLQLIQGGRIAP